MNWEAINSRREKYIRKYSRIFYRILLSQVKQVIRDIRGLTDLSSIENVIDLIIVNEDIKNTYIQIFKDVGIKEFNELGSYMVGRLKKNELDDLYIEDLENYAIQNAASKVVWMEETTRRLMLRYVREGIQEGIAQGLGINEIARNIEQTLNALYVPNAKKRAVTIAQTEVISASNRGSFMAAKNLGIELKKTWITAPIGIAKKERHNLLEIRDVNLNEPFEVDGVYLMFPGDPNGSPQNVINCRCTNGFIPV